MPHFNEMIGEAGGGPIIYKDMTITSMDNFAVDKGEKLRFIFESVSPGYRQGVRLKTKGFFIINEQKTRSWVVIWRDSAPDTFEFTVMSKDGKLWIMNVWDRGDGFIMGAFGGAAMSLEDLPNGRRYRCNDGDIDEDFNDIVFRIERVSAGKPIGSEKTRRTKKAKGAPRHESEGE